ncbi:MAG: L-threonylcarbamoyladenylate synthase [Acidimicrobiales bacterium]
MPTLSVAADAPAAIEAAVRALLAGEAVVLPTETVYGVAALPTVPGATARLFALKGRPQDVPLAVLVDDVEQAERLADFPPTARRLAERHWPGPLTLVLPRRADATALVLGGDPETIGIRCPDHDLVRAIARRVGPIATTSANRHGQPTPRAAAEAAAALADGVAVLLDGGRCGGVPSTVVDATGEVLRVLRVGTISEAALRAAQD